MRRRRPGVVVAWVVGGGDEEEEDGEEEEDSVLAALPCSTPSAMTRTTKLQARSCFPHDREEHLGEAMDARAVGDLATESAHVETRLLHDSSRAYRCRVAAYVSSCTSLLRLGLCAAKRRKYST